MMSFMQNLKNSYPALHLVTRLIKLALLRIFGLRTKFLSHLRVFYSIICIANVVLKDTTTHPVGPKAQLILFLRY